MRTRPEPTEAQYLEAQQIVSQVFDGGMDVVFFLGSILAERDRKISVMRLALEVADKYNADHTKFSPCDEIRYFNMVKDAIAEVTDPVEPTVSIIERFRRIEAVIKQAAPFSAYTVMKGHTCFGCDMGAAGPGPRGEHDPECEIKKLIDAIANLDPQDRPAIPDWPRQAEGGSPPHIHPDPKAFTECAEGRCPGEAA